MWRNISWNSTDSTLPEGMHRHETGPYFKTPSMQSAGSSQSGGTIAPTQPPTAPGQGAPVILCATDETQQLKEAPIEPAQLAPQPTVNRPADDRPDKRDSFESVGQHSQPSASSMLELVGAQSPRRNDNLGGSEPEAGQPRSTSTTGATTAPVQQQQQMQRRTRFKETPRQMSSGGQQQQLLSPGGTNSSTHANQSAPGHHHGFRSRLSSISGALQHPKLARRFFSGHSDTSDHQNQQQASTVQITTTSIDSPQHGRADSSTGPNSSYPMTMQAEHEPRPLTSSSGRRLSQLFLPQMNQSSLLNQMQDPYASNELIPPHLLGLYGQPPLVGGVGQTSPGGHRSSWADTSLFGRLSNVRPSLDSGYQGTGQMRHSFDARSEQCNEQDNEDSPNCMQIMKKLFFSLVLGTIVAICWVMIIHTLKWIAIRGNEFELWQLQLQQQQQLLLQAHTQLQPPSANYNSPDNIHQANLLLAHQSIQVAKQQQQQTSSNTTTAKSNNTMRTAEGVSNETAATSARPQLYQGDQEEADTGLVGQRRRRRRRGHRMSNNDTQASGRDDDEIKEALDRRTRRALLGQPAPTRASHEQFGRQAKRDNDASHSTAVVPFASMITGGRQQQLPGANRRIKQSTAQGDDDAGGQLPSLVGESGRIEELPQRRRLMQLSSISHEQVPRTNSNSNNNDKPVAADQYRQRPTAGLANQQSAGMRVLAEMGDENDELDSSGNDLTTILPLGPQNQPMNNGALDQSAAASATMSILPTSPASGDPDQSAPQHLSSAIERSPAPVDGQVGEAQVLVYKAPFFTSWFVSIWNIAFMPVFTIISSCCFRNEESTTKKLLAESISQFMDNGLTTLQFLGRCAFFSLLWIGTIFGIVYSLAYLDATVVMALFACSVALVYLLSWVLLHQQFVGVRIVAVIICTTGIALLAYMDNSKTLGSVLIVAGSALCSAVYKVIYQRMFGFWSIAQMSLFFTLIGLFNAFLMWPVALLLYFLGVELIAWRHIPWFHLIAAGALHLTANIVAYFGPICSYDIFLTLGLMFAVVLSAVIDVTFYKITFSGMKLAGVVLLMIGFLVCLLPENWNECLYDLANERFIRWKKQRSLKKSRNKVQDMSTGQMSRLRTPSGRVK